LLKISFLPMFEASFLTNFCLPFLFLNSFHKRCTTRKPDNCEITLKLKKNTKSRTFVFHYVNKMAILTMCYSC
jgi:hypothetical protein